MARTLLDTPVIIKKPRQTPLYTGSGQDNTPGSQFLSKLLELLYCGNINHIDRTHVYDNPFHRCFGSKDNCTHTIPEVIGIKKYQVGIEPVQNESRYGDGIREVGDMVKPLYPLHPSQHPVVRSGHDR